MRRYTSDQLLVSLRQLTMSPNVSADGSDDDDLLLVLDEALKSYVYPELMASRESYFLLRSRTTISSSTSRYRLPVKAAYQKLEGLWLVDSSGNRDEMHLLPEGAVDDFRGYRIEGNHVVLYPDTNHNYSGSLEFVFYARPGDLVLTSTCRQITAIDTATKVATVAAVPSDWTTSLTYDVHSQHSGAEYKIWDETASAVSGTSFTFSTAVDGSSFGTSAIEVGDWICEQGECVIPPIPTDMHPALVRAAALQIAESLGDQVKVTIHSRILERMFKRAAMLAAEGRVESKPIRPGRYSGILNHTSGRW
jgi:hypothetical protein